ncbi:MAG: hypothetical protein A2V66_14915 [Ignavibacteria bacterium RBG_13_36_8]|nr:MAG: hypothetical protein A2V66_14915 [Ignavibacteria bacterium RBG_13_36_8]
MFKSICGLLLIITIVGCATAGNKIDRTHIDEIRNGVQNKEQIRGWFGEPYTITTNLQGHPSGCTERWTFEYSKAQGFGTVTYTEILVVDFDAEGKVCDHAFSVSGSE